MNHSTAPGRPVSASSEAGPPDSPLITFDQVKERLRSELKQLRDDMTQLLTKAVEAGNEADTGTPVRFDMV